MTGDGSGGTTGRFGIGMESSDDDSASGTLQSMGYIDDETKIGGEGEDSTDSSFSILQWILLVLLAILGVYVVYVVLTGILALLGIQLL
ncbi:hypothetical protein ACFQL4_11125 [Halosimplex aquaticum]